MTSRLPELAALPAEAVLDGELVALGDDGWPYFPLVCQRLLNGDSRIPLTYVVFDLLELEGQSTMHRPHLERRHLLESLELAGPHWQMSPSFDDGEALLTVACERGLEGVVAKKIRARAWVKAPSLKIGASFLHIRLDGQSHGTRRAIGCPSTASGALAR